MADRLADATSPYLRQHAHQPVDWWPWGDAALAEAARLDRPLLVSIGYASCHWCHVMAHESFDDPAVAAAMNAAFVCVKVDREERPDVDALYMAALQAMTGRGGWPLNAFATPDGRPFYAGTYFPPQPRHGLPGWSDVVAAVADAWRQRRDDIESHARALVEGLATTTAAPRGAAAWRDDPAALDAALDAAAAALADAIDPVHGGFGGAPKFPQAGALRFLLQRGARRGEAGWVEAVWASLTAMVQGGLHDQLGGGFHRYCVDRSWTVPHFEKMLYDNAQLLSLLADAWRSTRREAFAAAARHTVRYLLDELRTPDGRFWSAQDADTAAGEGAYHTWTPAELAAALGPADAALAGAWFGITAGGHTDDGRSVPTERATLAAVAVACNTDADDVTRRLPAIRRRLLEVRRARPAPATDTKVIAGWNALAIDALARAGAALDEPGWVDAAAQAATALAATLTFDTPAGPRLAHHEASGRRGVAAFCDDVAGVVGAQLSLYEATCDPAWLAAATAAAGALVADFAPPSGGPFARTGPHHPRLAASVPDLVDSATPSGNAAACAALLRLAAATGDDRWALPVAAALRDVAPAALAAPEAFGDTLVALDAWHGGVRTVTLSGRDAVALARTVHRRYNGATVLRLRPPAASSAARPRWSTVPTAEVCAAGRCLPPAATPAALEAALVETDAR